MFFIILFLFLLYMIISCFFFYINYCNTSTDCQGYAFFFCFFAIIIFFVLFFFFRFLPNFYVNELTFFHFDYYIHHLLNTSASFSSAVCYTCIFKATSLYSSESAPYFNLVSLNVLCCSNPGLPDTFFNF